MYNFSIKIMTFSKKGLNFNMAIIVCLLSVWVFIRTLSYGIFELKENSNTFGGIATIVLAVLSLILPITIMLINGLY